MPNMVNIQKCKYINLNDYIFLFLQDSLTVVKRAMVDRSVENAPVLSRFQFERVGFFAVDSDSTKEKV